MSRANEALFEQFEELLAPAATRCLRAASSRDHVHAEAVRRRGLATRSLTRHGRAGYLSALAAFEEAAAADLLRESR